MTLATVGRFRALGFKLTTSPSCAGMGYGEVIRIKIELKMCLYENFMRAIDITMSQPIPLPEVEEIQEPVFRNQWALQISAQANSKAVDKLWPQEPEIGHRTISNQEEFDRIYGQRFEGLKVL